MPKAANPTTQGVVSLALADTHNITAPLVSYLKRLRTLDEQSVLLTRKIEGVVDGALEETRSGKRGKGGDGGDKTLADRDDAGQTDLKKNLAIADEKVTLAQQAYDLVEQHIARLDKDLRLFDNALAEKEAQIAIGKGLVVPPTLAAGDGGTGSGAGNGNAVAVAGAAGGISGAAATQSLGIPNPAPNPVPDGETFCVCKRVSFGEMIACENETCVVEWFHFACVGLSSDAKIKGKWFCATCAAEKRRVKKLEAKLLADKTK